MFSVWRFQKFILYIIFAVITLIKNKVYQIIMLCTDFQIGQFFSFDIF